MLHFIANGLVLLLLLKALFPRVVPLLDCLEAVIGRTWHFWKWGWQWARIAWMR